MKTDLKESSLPILKSLGCLGIAAITSAAESTITGGALGLFGKVTYDIVSGLSGDMLSDQIGNIDPAQLRKAFQHPGVDISNHDLHKALKDAMKIALTETARQYKLTQKAPDAHFRAIHRKMGILCDQIDEQYDDHFLYDIKDENIKSLADGREEATLNRIVAFIDIDELQSHGNHFLPYVQKHFPPNIIKAFTEILKTNARVWVAYQRLTMADIKKGVDANSKLSSDLLTKVQKINDQLEMIQKLTVYEESKETIDQEALTKIWSMFEEACAHRADSLSKLKAYHVHLLSKLSQLSDVVVEIKADTDALLNYSQETITISKKIYQELIAHQELSDQRHEELKSLIVNLTQEVQSNTAVAAPEKRERALNQVPEIAKNIIAIEKDPDKLQIVAEAEAALSKPNGVEIALLLLDMQVLNHAAKEARSSKDVQKVTNAFLLRIELLKPKFKYAEIIQCYLEIIELLKKSKFSTQKLANYYYNLGGVYLDNGQYNQALDNYKKCLSIEKQALNKNNPSLALTYNNMGSAYDRKGQYEEALNYYELCKLIQEQELDKNDLALATTYNNIGSVYYNKGQYEKALKYYGIGINIQEQALDKNHPSIAFTYINIGQVYTNMGQYEEALNYYEKGKKIQEKKLAKNHPELARTYNNIGLAYTHKGQYEQALRYYEMCKDIEEQVLAKNHPNRATTYNNIGGVYKNLGRYKEALEYYEMCKNIEDQMLDENHPNRAITFNNIGLLYKNMGRYDEALKNYEMCKNIRKQVLGKNHPALGSIYNNISYLLYEKLELKKALQYNKEAIRIFNVAFSADNPYVRVAEKIRGQIINKINEET